MKYTNSTSFRLLHKLDHVKSLSQVGIRSMRDHKSDVNDALNNGSHIIKMSEIRHKVLKIFGNTYLIMKIVTLRLILTHMICH